MSNPTQAQIEAAACALYCAEFDKSEWLFYNAKQLFRDKAKAALSAAAQVEEQNDSWNDGYRAGEKDAKERSAQVAEWKGYSTVGRQIAAQIRGL